MQGERKAPEGWDKNAFTQMAYGKFYAALTLPSWFGCGSCDVPPAERRTGYPGADHGSKQTKTDPD